MRLAFPKMRLAFSKMRLAKSGMRLAFFGTPLQVSSKKVKNLVNGIKKDRQNLGKSLTVSICIQL